MLYQTHPQPPFLSSSSSLSSFFSATTISLKSPNFTILLPQAIPNPSKVTIFLMGSSQTRVLLASNFPEMERVEMALKSSSRKDLAMKLSPPAFIDELLAVSVQNAVSGGAEDFSVDDLLDLPNDDESFLEEEETHEEENPLNRTEGSPVSSDEPQDDENAPRQTTDFSAGEDFSVPAEDLADLEWLSNFVEDSFSERSTPPLMSEKPSWLTGIRKQPEAPVADDSCFKSPVPAKARTKRARTAAGSVWFLGSASLTDSSSSSSSTSSTSSLSSPWLLAGESELLELPSVPAMKSASKKKSKKKQSVSGHQAPAPRRCSHCGVQKTPQWRAGPMGAKTLCNACGVRFKSGRLLPEYRPACSPNFSSEMHSNSHRKVMEMRRKKENTVMEQVEPGLNQPVQTRPAVPSF